MQIDYLGHSSFRIKGQNATIVTDPFHDTASLKFPRLPADIVTVSHDHEAHNNVEGVAREDIKFVITGPGEYEIKEINIFGIGINENTVYLIEVEGLSVCHLGALDEVLTANQVEELAGVDILFIPVGIKESLEAKTAIEVINQIEPLMVIPMHYSPEELEKFAQELGVKNIRYEKKLSIKKSNLPQEMEVVVLACGRQNYAQ